MSYTYATVFLFALLLARSLVPFVAGLAVRVGAVDLPAERKVHRGVIPRMGGLALIAGVVVPAGLLFFVDTDVARQFRSAKEPLLGVFLGLIPILVLGIVDDMRGTSAMVKFPVQILAGVIAYLGGCRIDEVSNPLTGQAVDLGWLALPATVLWIVVVTNAINLIDGLDGLATGITAFVAATLFTLSNANGNLAVAAVALAVCGASIGFLRYNFPPASIFLGDTGSLGAGYLIASISVLGAQKTSTAVALFVPIVVLGVPLFDTFTSFGRRVLRFRHPFRADAEHIHHRILARGYSPLGATLILYAVTGVLMVMALMVAYFDNRGSLKPMGWTLFATAAFLLAVGGLLGYLNVAELRIGAVSSMRSRRLQRRRLRVVEAFRKQLAVATEASAPGASPTPPAVWELLAEHLEMMDFASFWIEGAAGEKVSCSRDPGVTAEPACYHARALVVGGRLVAQVTAMRSGSAIARAHDAEALDQLIGSLAGALGRAAGAPITLVSVAIPGGDDLEPSAS